MPNPCNYQNHDWSMSYFAKSGSEGWSLKVDADGVNDEKEGEVCEVHEI